jgi:hypothetical protein
MFDSTPTVGVYVNQTSRVSRARRRTRASAASGSIPAAGVSGRALPAAERLTQTATLEDRRESWDIRCLAIELHHPQVLRSHNETRAIAIGLPSGEEPRASGPRAPYLLVADVVAT